MTNSTPITLRRAAALRELADLGCWQSKCAALLDIEPVRVHQIGRQFGIKFPKRPNFDTPLCRAIRAGYEAGLKPAQVAERLGSSTSSVKVLASKMGLTKDSTKDPAKYRRGFELPLEMRSTYRELRDLGLTIEEAGINLGLLARPSVEGAQQ